VLWHYVGDRLRKLKRWGFIGYDAVTNKYFIIAVEEEKQKAAITTTIQGS
jgi:uncharacterized protein YlbG (UPF0298 family)